ncbi:MAG: hypothetical protein ACYC64_00430 [Armatimonadota bacterium]
MLTALNEVTNLVEDILATGEGRLCVQSEPNYLNLGEVIGGASGGAGYQVAASAVVKSAELNGLSWVRNWIIGIKSTQSYDAGFLRRIVGTDDYHALASAQSSSAPGYRGHGANESTTAGNNLLGDTVQFYVKNVGGSAADIWAQVQLMG